MNNQLPDRLTFKRAEVTRITKLDGKVIDYWAKEFGVINPMTNKMGEVFYSRGDVETILKIKQLMIVERVEKSRIKKILTEDFDQPAPQKPRKQVKESVKPHTLDREKLSRLRKELQDILTILDKNGTNTL